jgi:hypothetical protein
MQPCTRMASELVDLLILQILLVCIFIQIYNSSSAWFVLTLKLLATEVANALGRTPEFPATGSYPLRPGAPGVVLQVYRPFRVRQYSIGIVQNANDRVEYRFKVTEMCQSV